MESGAVKFDSVMKNEVMKGQLRRKTREAMRAARFKGPLPTSAEAYAQMESMRAAAKSAIPPSGLVEPDSQSSIN